MKFYSDWWPLIGLKLQFAVLLAIALNAGLARAEGEIIHNGRTLAATPGVNASICHVDQEECRSARLKLLSGAKAGIIEIGSGVEAKGRNSITRLEGQALAGDFPIGRVRMISVFAQFADVASARGWGGQLLESESLYFCRRAGEDTQWPIWGPLHDRCEPNSAWALEFSLLKTVFNDDRPLNLTEWARGGVSYDLLFAGQGVQHVFRSLQVVALIDGLQTRYASSDPGPHWRSHLGLTLGIRGHWRSSSGLWELQGGVYNRQGMFIGEDESKTATLMQKIEVSYNWMSRETWLLQPGLRLTNTWKGERTFPNIESPFSQELQEFEIMAYLRLLPRMNL